MDQERVIAAIAKRQGILLQLDDPILSVNTMLEVHAARLETLAAQDEQARAAQRADTQAATAAVQENSRRGLLSDVQVKEYVVPRLLGSWILSIIVVMAVLMTGTGVGCYFWGRSSVAQNVWAGLDGGGTRCDPAAEDGSELCWIPVYRRPPPTPVPTAPATSVPATTAPATRATKSGQQSTR